MGVGEFRPGIKDMIDDAGEKEDYYKDSKLEVSMGTISGVTENGDVKTFKSTDDSELFITETEREKNVAIFNQRSITTNATHWFGMIDLSDTTNWPHDETGRIDLSAVLLATDKALNSRGSLMIGVITRVDDTDADVSFVVGFTFDQNDTESQIITLNLAPTQIKCGVSGGELTRIKTAIKALNVSAINTNGGDLTFASGITFTPAVGDIVIRIIKSAGGNFNYSATTFYHADASST